MRFMTLAIFYGVLAVGAAGGGAAMAASGTIELRATATFSDGTTADRLYRVRSDEDSDGDGLGDEAWLRVRCDNGIATAVYEHSVKSPRDVATGQSSGKRMHRPMMILKEWGAREPGAMTGSKVSWDLATNKGGKATWNLVANKGGRTASPETSTYDVKKVEGTGARTDPSRASDASAGDGADKKTMAHDDWHQVTLADGAPNLCS